MNEGAVNHKIAADARELFAVRILDEADFYFSTLPVVHHHRLVEKLVRTAAEGMKADAQLVADLIARVVSKELCSVEALRDGLLSVSERLEDIAMDAPNA
ncbi:hypothetical protein DFH08DRAFT_720958, partial [Mycena albidolilacea]